MDFRLGRRALLLTVASGVGLLVGCTQVDSSHERLDYWASRLSVGSWGTVAVEDHAGSNSFSDETPTLTLLMSSAPSVIHEHAVQALAAEHFQLKGDEWSSQGDNEYRTVNIKALPPGAKVYLPGARRSLALMGASVRVPLQVSSSTTS